MKFRFAILFLLFYHNSKSVEIGSFLGGFPTFWIYGTGGHLGVDLLRGLLRLRFGCADGLLRGEPPAIGPTVQVLFQLLQRSLVRLLRTTGSVVVEIDRQFLKVMPTSSG